MVGTSLHECSGGGSVVTRRGSKVSCPVCRRRFPLASTSRRVGREGRVLPSHKLQARLELAIPVVDGAGVAS